jgi:predicted branched-subunit amino acid permease
MTVSLLPVLRGDVKTSWRHYAGAQVLAMSAWTFAMRRCPEMPQAERMPYYLGFGTTMVSVCTVAVLLGFFLSSAMPKALTLMFLMSNPLFFVLLLWPSRTDPMLGWALFFGCFVGPIAYTLSPNSSVVVTGFAGGTLAYLLTRWQGSKVAK